MVIALVATLVAVVAALIAWRGARAAREAVVLARGERVKEHWRRLADAIDAVRRAAEDYQDAMARQLALANGREARASRSEDVRDAAREYREACARLSLALAGGPTPERWRDQLPMLLDRHRPEEVAQSSVAQVLIDEIGLIQERLRLEEEASLRPPASIGELADRWRWRAVARVRATRLGR